MTQKVLSFDLGGTKLAAAVVSSRGKVLKQIRVPAAFEQGKTAVIKQIVTLGRELIKQFQEIKTVGIASAGPLDPVKGVLLDPTNFVSDLGRWGRVPFTAILEKKLQRKVFLENDAAAAILAEHWVGAAKNHKNAIILTLGTGLGTGIICNGELVRSGHHFHTEAGHMVIRAGDPTATCGCGNLGCAEAFLSGRNFARRTAKRLDIPFLSADEITDMARRDHRLAKAAFEEYSTLMAVTLYNLVRIFNPEIFIFTGGFAAASDLFLKPTIKKLDKSLNSAPKQLVAVRSPKIVVSSLHNDAGLIGAAYRAVKHARY